MTRYSSFSTTRARWRGWLSCAGEYENFKPSTNMETPSTKTSRYQTSFPLILIHQNTQPRQKRRGFIFRCLSRRSGICFLLHRAGLIVCRGRPVSVSFQKCNEVPRRCLPPVIDSEAEQLAFAQPLNDPTLTNLKVRSNLGRRHRPDLCHGVGHEESPHCRARLIHQAANQATGSHSPLTTDHCNRSHSAAPVAARQNSQGLRG